ncbi:hypothetical protein LEMLEM_LOCUS21544 [Lemmus lemmus]
MVSGSSGFKKSLQRNLRIAAKKTGSQHGGRIGAEDQGSGGGHRREEVFVFK